VLTILGVTLTNGLSVSQHVQTVLTSCAQTVYALCVLRAHGLFHSALQTIFRAIVVAKLMCGSSAWRGFVSGTDRQKLSAYLTCYSRWFSILIMTLKNYVIKLISSCSTRFYTLHSVYWNNCCHPLSHRAVISENGRTLDRLQTPLFLSN